MRERKGKPKPPYIKFGNTNTSLQVRFGAMSQTIHIVAGNITGYGPSDSRYLACSGVSGRTVADCKVLSQVKIASIKCPLNWSSFICKASSGGQRRNPDFSRQNRQGFSRSRNRKNEERSGTENLEESEVMSSRNGPLLSFANSQKFQPTATPGPREREIVELFRKVQAQLRERAAIKEEKKIETMQGQKKESETVDSLLKLLRKHSVEQGKRSSSGSGKDFILDQPEPSGPFYEEKNLGLFDSNGTMKGEAQGPNNSSPTRPISNFRRKSPVPRVKYRPGYDAGDTVNSVSRLKSSPQGRKKSPVETWLHPEPEPEPESELEPEPELEVEVEPIFSNGHVLDEILEVEPSDDDEAYGDDEEEPEEKHTFEGIDLSAMKLTELREIAKSRGMKGFSKLKKSELFKLLSEGSM